MKKMFSMVMSLIMLIGIVSIMPTAAYADTARELLPIKDTGFETASGGDGLIANGWQSASNNSSITSGKVSIETDPANVYNGCHSLKVTGGKGAYYILNGLKSGTSYTLGVWVKVSEGSAASFRIENFKDLDTKATLTDSIYNTTKFVYRTIEFTTGENNNSAKVICQSNWDGVTGWFDDFKLVETSTLATKNLIKNPGFETAYFSPSGGQWWNQDNAKVEMQRKVGEENYAHSGEYCLRYGAPNATMEQEVTGLKENTMYTLNFWIKADNPAGFGAGVKEFDTNEKGEKLSVSASTTNTDAYEKKTINFKTGKGITSAKVYVYSAQTGWADDFELYETTCLNNVTLNDNAGEEKSVPTAGKNIITATVANTGSENITPRVIAAYYNSNNVLEQVEVSDESLAIKPSGTETVTLTFENLPDDAAEGKIRVFLFDGFGSLKPLDNSVAFGTQNKF